MKMILGKMNQKYQQELNTMFLRLYKKTVMNPTLHYCLNPPNPKNLLLFQTRFLYCLSLTRNLNLLLFFLQQIHSQKVHKCRLSTKMSLRDSFQILLVAKVPPLMIVSSRHPPHKKDERGKVWILLTNPAPVKTIYLAFYHPFFHKIKEILFKGPRWLRILSTKKEKDLVRLQKQRT